MKSINFSNLFRTKELFILSALVASTIVLFFYLFNLTGIHTPAFYYGDTLYFLQMIKNVVLFHTPFHGELSAPFPPELYLFPGVTLPWIVIINIISFFSNDVFVINNIFVITVCVIHALTFYVVVRLLGIRCSLAFLGAICFSLLPFGIYRAFVHQALMPMFAVPIGCYLALLCFYQPKIVLNNNALCITKLRLHWVPLIIACALVGISGHYWVGFTCIFIFSSSMITSLSNRALSPLLFGVYLSIAILVFFLLSQLPSLIAAWQTAVPMPPSPRGPTDQALYGLRVMDLFVPVDSSYTYLNKLIAYYKTVRFPNYSNPAFGQVEGQDSYLGLLGLLGLFSGLLLFIGSIRVFSSNKKSAHNFFCFRYRLVVGSALLSIVGMLFSITNGFGNIFHILITTALRAQNRVSVFLAFFAILVLLIIFENYFRKQKSKVTSLIVYIILFAVTALSIRLQTDFLSIDKNSKQLAAIIERERDFFSDFTARLGSNRQILQLPIMEFPGSPPVVNFYDYEHFRGSLFTTGNRWSYGTMMARPAVLWQTKLASLPVEEMVAQARAVGFDVLLLERRGYTDKGKQVVDDLVAILGSNAIVLDKDDRIIFDLCRHNGEKQLPVIAEDRYRGFSFLQGGPNGITLRWNDTINGHAKFALENYDNASRTVTIEGLIVTGYNDPFVLFINGPNINFKKQMVNGDKFTVDLTVPSGINLYDIWTSAKQLIIPTDPRKLFFSLWDFKVIDHKFETSVNHYRNHDSECSK